VESPDEVAPCVAVVRVHAQTGPEPFAATRPARARDTRDVLRAVIFDLDGVLLDSEQLWDAARRAVVADHDREWRDGATGAMQGMSSREWSRYLREQLGLPLSEGQIVDLVVGDVLARFERELPLIPGAAAAVHRLGARWPLGIASSSNRVVIERVLDLSGLRGSFEAIVSSEEVPHGKPFPDVYVRAARLLDARAEDCAAVEDSANGIRSAFGAGMRVVVVPNALFPPTDDDLARADLVLAGLDELTVDTLEGIGDTTTRLDRQQDEQEIESFPASDPHSDWAGPDG